jgi:glucose-1-phosphate adenylyltransferase
MDYRPLLETHVASGLSATLGCVEVPAALASGLRVVRVGSHGRVVHFADRLARRQPSPRDSATVLVSAGVCVFDRDSLVDCLSVDAEDRWSSHDFGRDVLPLLIRAGGVAAHVWRDPQQGRSIYWRELGTLDRYWRANLELLAEQPVIDFADRGWPLWTLAPQGPPPRVLGSGTVARSIVSAGCMIGGCVEGSVLSPECVVRSGAAVLDSVLLPGVHVGSGTRISRAVVDSGCVVPDGIAIGEDAAEDAASFEVSAEGVALVTADGLARALRNGRLADSVLV